MGAQHPLKAHSDFGSLLVCDGAEREEPQFRLSATPDARRLACGARWFFTGEARPGANRFSIASPVGSSAASDGRDSNAPLLQFAALAGS